MIQFSALEISQKIRQRELTSLEVVNYFIARIQAANHKVNAVVETRYDQARLEAKDCDAKIAQATTEELKTFPPFFGVPCTIKEMISVNGMHSTLGSIHRRDQIMKDDATVVERLKKAGAIVLGTTNVPEVGFWFECDNVVYGKTSNPFDTTRTSGGSSGGEGAILALAGSPIGMGSDIGGSIRLPAAFCGVFGHKPSEKIIPFTGHVPVYKDTAKDLVGSKYPFTVVGPMARKSSDLYAMLKILVGPDEYDQETKKNFFLKPLLSDPAQLKIHYIASPIIHGTTETETDLSQSVIHASRYLQGLGAQAQEMAPRTFIQAFELWTGRAWSIEGKHFPTYLTNGEPLAVVNEFFNLIIGKRRYTLPSLLTAITDNMVNDRSKKDELLSTLAQLKASLTHQLGQDGVIIMPVHPRKAPKHHSTYTRPFDFSYTGIFNALGFPATAVPMGLSKEGLPLSVQVIAAEDQDHLCLSVARWLEDGFGGALLP